MNKVNLLLSMMFLLVTVCLGTSSGAADLSATETLAVTKLTDLCSKAAQDPRDIAAFRFENDLSMKGYKIKVYGLKNDRSDPNPAKRISVMLDKGTDSGVEIPRITVICKNNVQVKVTNKGDIEFSADPKIKKVPISFRLLPSLQYTHWKNEGHAESNDSVWMSDNSTGNIVHPGQADWPKCMKEKHVRLLDAKTIVFPMCENLGTDLRYFYTLHMDLIGSDNVSVDVGIDPQIIHHPNVVALKE